MDKDASRKIRVGILLDAADGFMNRKILNDCIDSAEANEMHPIFFFGGQLTPGREQDSADFLYGLPSAESLDALVVFPHSIAPWDPVHETENIIKKKYNLPVYSANERLPNHFSVTVDETVAVHMLIDHLVLDHKYRFFSLLCGPDASNSLSRKRRKIIEDRLAKYNISIPSNLIFAGQFSQRDGHRAVEDILKMKSITPEVLICFNDQMAAGAIEELLDCGIAVPADIAVTGFDDVEENNLLPCTFSTVHIPVWEMLNTLMRRIKADLSSTSESNRKKNTDEISLQAVFSQNESCGCSESSSTTIPKNSELISKIQDSRQRNFRHDLEKILEETLSHGNTDKFCAFLKKTARVITRTGDISSSFIDVFSSLWTTTLLRHTDIEKQILANTLFVDAFRLLVRTKMNACARIHANDRGALVFSQNTTQLLSRNLTMHESLVGIADNLSNLGIERCLLVFTDPVQSTRGTIRLLYRKRHELKIPKKNFPQFPVAELINSELFAKTYPLAVMPIALGTNIFGYFVVSVSENSFEEFSLIRNLFSRIIASAAANESLSLQIVDLEKKNTVLSRLSSIDEVTGLYNRRVLNEIGKTAYVHAVEAGESCCCIFFDMDGLKHINDEQGHPEGDVAIRTLAAILKRSFRKKDFLVRYGGDEFVVLMFDITEFTVKNALERISHQIEKFNLESGKPWQLQTSWGITFIPQNAPALPFDTLIEETDRRLYEEKQRRRKAGLR